IERVVAAFDIGRVINPDGARNQMEGGIVQALSRTLKEQVTFDKSAVTSVDWDHYPIMDFSEVPEIDVVLLDRPDEESGGAGERPGRQTLTARNALRYSAATPRAGRCSAVIVSS